jgi:nitrate reductase delta subunit
MDGEVTRRRAFELLADVLEYPRPDLVEAVRECAALLAADSLAAAACLHEFGTFVGQTPRGRLEEVYTSTFDLDAACYPYVGYHLFGESYQRSVFMVELNKRYRAHGFSIAGELPDYLAVVLRFLAVCDDAVLSGEIVHEALLPALEHMDPWGTKTTVPSPETCRGGTPPPLQSTADQRPDGARRGYWLVLRALQLVLRRFPAKTPQQEPAPTNGKDSSPHKAGHKANGGQASAKTLCALQRVKSVCKIVAKRRASAQRIRELW